MGNAPKEAHSWNKHPLGSTSWKIPESKNHRVSWKNRAQIDKFLADYLMLKKIENHAYIDLIISDLNFDNLHGYQLWYANRGLVQIPNNRDPTTLVSTIKYKNI